MLNDLRYGARILWKSPLVTLAIVLTVALGIGANTAIFSVVNAVMLRPLPYEQPDRLVWVAERNDKLNLPTFAASVLNYLSWKEQQRTFSQLGAAGFANFNLTGEGEPEQFGGGTLTPSLFPLLGIRPVLGRSFADGEDRPGSARVAMISEGLWKRRFGGDPSVVGRSLTLNGVDHTVVGIAPASLALLSNGDIWIPLTIQPEREVRLNHVILITGRLRPGVRLEQAQAEMDAVAARVSQQYPDMRDWGIRLVDYYHVFVSPRLQTALVVLLAAVGCVSAHRLGQRGEPAARARDGSAEGNRCANGNRCEPHAIAPAVADREPRVVGGRRHRRHDRGGVGRRWDQCADAGELIASGRERGRQRAALCSRVDDCDWPSLRACSGVARRQDRSERGAHAGDAHVERSATGAAEWPCRCRTCAGDRTADRRGSPDAESPAPATR